MWEVVFEMLLIIKGDLESGSYINVYWFIEYFLLWVVSFTINCHLKQFEEKFN